MVSSRVLVVGLGLLGLLLAGATTAPPVLPGGSFEDQEGHTLQMESLQGTVVVIVYGARAGVDHHVAWGKRLDAELRDRGVYRLEDPPERRPVRILAVAQMGGIPSPFRSMLRAVLRQHVEKGFSLWLDWEDQMGKLFGAHDSLSSVVVADRAGAVHLVVVGEPGGEPYRSVSEMLRRLAP
jgi:hypothetical protein